MMNTLSHEGMFILVAVAVLTVVSSWNICTKAGFPGVIALFMLIPIGNLALLLYLAFAEWPALKRKN